MKHTFKLPGHAFIYLYLSIQRTEIFQCRCCCWLKLRCALSVKHYTSIYIFRIGIRMVCIEFHKYNNVHFEYTYYIWQHCDGLLLLLLMYIRIWYLQKFSCIVCVLIFVLDCEKDAQCRIFCPFKSGYFFVFFNSFRNHFMFSYNLFVGLSRPGQVQSFQASTG